MKQNPYIHGLYLNFFLPLYRKNQIHFDKDLFSKSEILDILGQEKDSFQRLTQYAGNLIDYGIEDLKILVVGTGSGVLASQLFERLDPHELIEIDINPSVIDRRIKHNHNSRRVAKLINVESMPFEDGYFHLVIAYGVMRYVHDIERSLHEMARVMHPQGLIVVGEGRKADIIDKIEQLIDFRNIRKEREVLNNVQLPNLTFAFALIERYKANKDKVFRSTIQEIRRNNNGSLYETIFRLAGVTEGDIYLLKLQKHEENTSYSIP